MQLIELKEFFETNTFDKPIIIRKNEIIRDVNKYAKGLIYVLEKRKGKRGYLPYYNTLIEIYKQVKQTL
jgi:hypothetical protein